MPDDPPMITNVAMEIKQAVAKKVGLHACMLCCTQGSAGGALFLSW